MLYEFVHPKKNITEVPFFNLLPSDNLDLVQEHLDEFFYTMYERQEIWYKRNVLKQNRPWTKDAILNDFRFTNVYRELDRSSQYLIKTIISNDALNLHEKVFQTLVYRYFNKPDCFLDGHIEMPEYDTFDPKTLHRQVIDCRERYYNPWHVAYMSNLVWAKKPKSFEGSLFKDHAYCRILFPIFHEHTDEIVKMLLEKATPQKLMKKLEKLPSISGFMSHELFLDFSYLNKYSLVHSVDFDENSYTNVGPGASLGIKLIFPSLEPKDQREAIYLLRDISAVKLAEYGDFKYAQWNRITKKYDIIKDGNLTLHAVEMMLCEFSKWKKMQWGVGKQRSKYLV